MHTGEGLHRFVDPVDKSVYLYTQFEVADSRRVFTVFEQPDLKATFAFTVTAPADWQVVSNQPTPGARAGSDWATRPGRSRRPSGISSYITALVAGPYHRVDGEYRDGDRVVPLGALLPRLAGRAPGHRRDLRRDPAGVRVLRGGLRHALPVREVRPAVRAGVQLRRDGERRLRDPQRGLRLPVAGAARCPTSGVR